MLVVLRDWLESGLLQTFGSKCLRLWRLRRSLLLLYVIIKSYHAKPLPPQGLFNSSIKPKAPKVPSNTWHHLALPMPNLRRLPSPANLKHFNPQQSQAPLYLTDTNTFIPQASLPNKSHPIAFTDAIHSTKSHCNLMPLFCEWC